METYRGMDRDALSEAYNNRAVVPDWEAMMGDWQQRSAALYQRPGWQRDLSYDPGNPRRRFDLFAGSRPDLPTLLYLHGGYWQWNDKEGQAFVAEGLTAEGFPVAIGEHSLAPEITMTGLAEEMRLLVRGVSRQARVAGRNPGVVLLGMSSGSHLLALTLSLPEVLGALLISGAYDLEPVRISPLNDAIGMSFEEARAHSPLHQPQAVSKPVVISFGADERPEICRQGADFHAALVAQGYPARLDPIPDTNHFTVLETLAAQNGALCRTATALALSLAAREN
ncbi:alpha/beta hydrolase [Pseudooceanicola algae]|uniref:BD-FAE-like domain-containing protein n=1 Tax=Pseudooceanicola algae TaxID=1537215 RepID=A0A418SLK6_9RHOB|nr:alpha/beta hydrolase [Pseudooceanicola algae]QPM90565.1 hypothetical protein PSAL_018040 [Pseudooceanicola algae]